MNAGFTALAAAGAIALLLCSAAFVPVSEAAQRCGGFAGLRCDPGFSCQMPDRRGADLMGVCVRAARACPRIYRPVCGRDGRTYSNDCVRENAHVGLWHRGRC